MIYRSKYKCRLCGKIYCGGAITNKGTAIQSMIEMAIDRCTIPQSPTKIDMHICDNGDIGCADFIGWKRGD